jgi:hypothetical protein
VPGCIGPQLDLIAFQGQDDHLDQFTAG